MNWNENTLKNIDSSMRLWAFFISKDKKIAVYFYNLIEMGMMRDFANFIILIDVANEIKILLNSKGCPIMSFAYDSEEIKNTLWSDDYRYILLSVMLIYEGKENRSSFASRYEACLIIDTQSNQFSIVPVEKAYEYNAYVENKTLKIKMADADKHKSHKEKKLESFKWVELSKLKDAEQLFFSKNSNG